MFVQLSKKSHYAILALFELALGGSQTPLTARTLAGRHSLPVRFLEIILNELKQAGFVRSIRGKSGGYVLSRRPAEITLFQVLSFLEHRTGSGTDLPSDTAGPYVFDGLIKQANTAATRIFETCTLEQLVQRELDHRAASGSNYVI